VGCHEGRNNIDDHFRHVALYDYLHKNIEEGYFCQKSVHVAGHEVQHSNLAQVNIQTEHQHHQAQPRQHEEKRGNQAENAYLEGLKLFHLLGSRWNPGRREWPQKRAFKLAATWRNRFCMQP